MNNVEVTYDFIEYIKDFIPRDHKPNDCEILSVSFGYRSCNFTYRSPVCDSIQDYELRLDAF